MNIKTVACLLSLLLLSACGGGDLLIDKGKENSNALEMNKEKWALRNVKSYQYQLRISCFCMQDVTANKQVTVSDGVVTDAFFVQTSAHLTAEELTRVKTIDELFSIVANAINDKAYMLEVTYNKEYGYPEAISIDYQKDVADDEVVYYANNLLGIPPVTITDDTTINTDDRTTGSGELNKLKQALDANQEKWALRNINSYQYTLSASCFCLNDITGKKQVTVLDGAVTEAFLLQTSQYLTPEELSRVKTVAELFTVVQQAIDTQAYQLSVSYNKDYGHPETIIIDRYKDMMDDEITYYVNDLM